MEVRVPDLSIKYALYGNVCASAVTYTPRALSLTHTHTHTHTLASFPGSPLTPPFLGRAWERGYTHTQYTDNKAMVCMNLSDFVWAQSMLSMRNDNQN